MIVHETPHWRINHRIRCPVPGYLMVGAKATNAVELSDLTTAAQQEIGFLLARATRILRADLGADRVYVARFGHEPGHTVHFHVIPVYSWIVEAFHADVRYAVEPNPDGANLTLFIWREYCESDSPPSCTGPSVTTAVATIRKAFKEDGGRTSA
jgi:diadenosine tetraphosphate (Ap4A) HIT family hydrolase